jgi:hypothetical protein
MSSLSASTSSRTVIPQFHPCGITVEIVGIWRSDRGRSCEEHDVCGTVLQEDSVVRIRHVQVTGEMGNEESALAVYWISDGIDRCRVGFLPRHLVKQWQQYDGRIPQVVELYQGSDSPTKKRKNVRNCGCCVAVLIDNRNNDSNN